MNVLIADEFDAAGVDELRSAGCEVSYDPALEGDGLRNAIGRSRCEALVVRSTRVTRSMIEAGTALCLVVRAGATVASIDLEAASRRCIQVANCPGKNAVAVAELTFALILALDRRLVEEVNDLRHGVWNKAEYGRARGLKGRTLGIVGLGRVGTAVAQRARAFEMSVVAWSRSLTYEMAGALGIARCQSPTDVASRCDILTLHMTATPQTEKIIGAEVLAALKTGSYVINTAHPSLLDHEALAAGVAGRELRVGLDVFEKEPSRPSGRFSDALIEAEGTVYGTHHIGSVTEQAQTAVAKETATIIKQYMRTGQVRNCVNRCQESPGKYVVKVRHLNRPGVLAHTLNIISHAGFNIEEMGNVIFEGGESACAQIKLDGELAQESLHEIESGSEHIISVSQTTLHP